MFEFPRRAFMAELSQALGQPAIVKNRRVRAAGRLEDNLPRG